jgi:hypothetical protein
MQVMTTFPLVRQLLLSGEEPTTTSGHPALIVSKQIYAQYCTVKCNMSAGPGVVTVRGEELVPCLHC